MKQIIYFYAGWCDTCQRMTPIIDQIQRSKKTQVAKIDTDYDASNVSTYNVQSVPTTIILENGKEIKRHVGYISHRDLLNDL